MSAPFPAGTAIVWTQNKLSRRAKVVGYVPAGTSPADLDPEIGVMNRRRIQFGNPSMPRQRDHYLVSRAERWPKAGDVLVYYLPYAACVEPVRGAA